MKETWKEMAVRLMDEYGICPKQESLDLIALNEALKIMDGKYATREQIVEKVVPRLTVAVINKIYYETEFYNTLYDTEDLNERINRIIECQRDHEKLTDEQIDLVIYLIRQGVIRYVKDWMRQYMEFARKLKENGGI